MGWVLFILFGTAVVLLIFNYVRTKRSTIIEQRKLDNMYLNFMEEINKLQDQIKNLELDSEITAQEVGISAEDRQRLRELLDLYRRGYSFESMAAKQQLEEKKVEEILAPYLSERRQVTHGH